MFVKGASGVSGCMIGGWYIYIPHLHWFLGKLQCIVVSWVEFPRFSIDSLLGQPWQQAHACCQGCARRLWKSLPYFGNQRYISHHSVGLDSVRMSYSYLVITILRGGMLRSVDVTMDAITHPYTCLIETQLIRDTPEYWQNMKFDKVTKKHRMCQIHSLPPSDAVCPQRCWSTIAHLMPCCLTAASHHLNQSCL